MPAPEAADLPTIIWIAGTGWDAVPGTDKRLVQELSLNHRIIWVDPPVRCRVGSQKSRLSAKGHVVAPNVLRVPVHTLPGITKPGIRSLTECLLNRAIRRAIVAAGTKPAAVVVAFPIAKFPPRVSGMRLLYVTDDWLEGSSLMGFSKRHIRRVLESNIDAAEVVAAVTPGILEHLEELGTVRNGLVLPNGCPIAPSIEVDRDRGRVIGLVGQLNERLDMDVLEALCRSGEKVLVVGPRSDREADFGKRLDHFLAAENVEWAGSVPHSALPEYFARMKVGVTPYIDSRFNRASFPLKTLEYLSAGLPVVATDLPAVKWLNSVHVQAAVDTADFTATVVATLDSEWTRSGGEERRQFARHHSWEQRAVDFSTIIEPLPRLTGRRGSTMSNDFKQRIEGTDVRN